LGDLFRYTEYWFSVKKGREKKHKPPPLDEVWKQIVDPGLNCADQVPAVRTGPSAGGPPQSAVEADSEQTARRRFRPGPRPVQLRLDFLDRLRAESDEVRDLLAVDEAPGAMEPSGADWKGGGEKRGQPDEGGSKGWKAAGWDRPGEYPGNGDKAAEHFWNTLGPLEREALRIILREGAATELDGWARKNGTMTELVIDGINEKFLEVFGDLLVETVDEGPRIQVEYKAEVKKWVGAYFL
jgi:hypothetical protein